MWEVFRKEGIEVERVALLGHQPGELQHLATYHAMDIALDTYPYHGTRTTCEALWMGVPVVTLAGTLHVSRVGVSLLTQVGLEELIATTPQEYVDKAVDLAHDAARLGQLHDGLREKMRRSPLCDGKCLARDLEGAYRGMWQDVCRRFRAAPQ